MGWFQIYPFELIRWHMEIVLFKMYIISEEYEYTFFVTDSTHDKKTLSKETGGIASNISQALCTGTAVNRVLI